jgi:catechol O-methyltransferase
VPSKTLQNAAGVAAVAGLLSLRARGLRTGALRAAALTAGAVAANEAAGKPVPFLRWSFLRLMVGMKHLTTEWQVGDGREDAVAAYVEAKAQRGDVDSVIAAIDDFARNQSILINVGDEKGQILDAAISAVKPSFVLELGTYVGYGALRLARCAPEARIVSVEFLPANAAIARRNVEHAGLSDRVTIVDGSIGDGGRTVQHLRDVLGLRPGQLDAVFLDHAKEHYLSDLHTIEDAGWLHPGSVVVADNVRFPGAPDYKAYMEEQEGKRYRTTEHATHVEYQSLLPDLVLESVYLG